MRTATAREAGMRDMFFSEALLAAQLDHPNLVQVHDYSETDGERFIVRLWKEPKSS